MHHWSRKRSRENPSHGSRVVWSPISAPLSLICFSRWTRASPPFQPFQPAWIAFLHQRRGTKRRLEDDSVSKKIKLWGRFQDNIYSIRQKKYLQKKYKKPTRPNENPTCAWLTIYFLSFFWRYFFAVCCTCCLGDLLRNFIFFYAQSSSSLLLCGPLCQRRAMAGWNGCKGQISLKHTSTYK